jgi:hypothetical protein
MIGATTVSRPFRIGSSAARLSSWMKVRLVATKRATRAIVCLAERVVTDGLSGGGVQLRTGVSPESGNEA